MLSMLSRLAPAAIQRRTWPWITLLCLIAIGHALDIITTLLAFQAGASEGNRNPLLALALALWGMPGVIALKVAGVLIVVALLLYFTRTPDARRGPYAALGLLSSCAGVALVWVTVAHNLTIIVALH